MSSTNLIVDKFLIRSTKSEIRLNQVMPNVKLRAHRAGLPGNEISFLLCPFLPAGRQGPRLIGGLCGALAGQSSKFK
jgi:hypothetical protein